MKLVQESIHITGTPVCRGIAVGNSHFFHHNTPVIAEVKIDEIHAINEFKRYCLARTNTIAELKEMRSQMETEKLYEGVEIIDAHLEIVLDPEMTALVQDTIYSRLCNADFAFTRAIDFFINKISKLSDPFFRERCEDLQEISRRLLTHLAPNYDKKSLLFPKNAIIFCENLSANDVMQATNADIGGIVTSSGGITSHAAIIIKAKGIPYITSVQFNPDVVSLGLPTILDAYDGRVIVGADNEMTQKYVSIKNSHDIMHSDLQRKTAGLTCTTEGREIFVYANVNTLDEVDSLRGLSINGIGLFRSESAFLNYSSMPTEEEQYFVYRNLIEKMQGLPVNVRSFDFGGDKMMPNGYQRKEINPFFGCRAIRFLLKEKNVFKAQIKAILRASNYGDISVMFPMITSLYELNEAKDIIHQAKLELAQEEVAFNRDLPCGCMIEVPSAALICDLIAKECDFLSLGTNDLVQYTLAVDRSNPHLNSVYFSPSHPAVIRLIKMVADAASRYNVPVSICGEMAADPRYAPLLIGLNIYQFSVAPNSIPVVKYIISKISLSDAHALAQAALTLSSSEEIFKLLDDFYRSVLPEGHLQQSLLSAPTLH